MKIIKLMHIAVFQKHYIKHYTIHCVWHTKHFIKYLQKLFYDSEGSFDYGRPLLDRIMTGKIVSQRVVKLIALHAKNQTSTLSRMFLLLMEILITKSYCTISFLW